LARAFRDLPDIAGELGSEEGLCIFAGGLDETIMGQIGDDAPLEDLRSL
jgi:hypothetical protein